VTVTAPADPATPDRPDPEHHDPDGLAVAGLAEWLHEDPAAAEEHEEAMRADSYQHEMHRRREGADRALGEVRARVSALIDKHNLDGRRTLSFWLGSAIVVALVVLDAIPLNWAAQAFDLNNADSWLVTLILLVASIGAMAGLEATRQDARKYAALAALTLTAYAGLVALRTSFLVTVAGEGFAAALLQAVVLSAISAGLVFLGSAVMARTRSLRLSRALAAARRARRTSQASEAAWRRAEEKLERHLGVLHRQLVRQPLYAAVPTGLTHPEWVAALERALRAQFTQR
jgi:cation transport ATPase